MTILQLAILLEFQYPVMSVMQVIEKKHPKCNKMCRAADQNSLTCTVVHKPKQKDVCNNISNVTLNWVLHILCKFVLMLPKEGATFMSVIYTLFPLN